MTRKRAGAEVAEVAAVQRGTHGAVALCLLATACAGRGLQSPPAQEAVPLPPLDGASGPPQAASSGPSSVAAGRDRRDAAAESPREEAPAPRTWVKVPGGAFVQSRTHGSDRIEPDDATRAELAKAGRRASGTFRLCLDDRGEVVLARAVIETGFPAYDEKILGELRAWRFQPYVIDGRPSGVCSEVSVTSPPTRTARRR